MAGVSAVVFGTYRAMQSFTRVVLPIVLVIGLVGGVTFMTQYSPQAPHKPPPKAAKAAAAKADRPFEGPSLVVPERVAVWDPRDINYGRELEIGTKAHYDFWITNG